MISSASLPSMVMVLAVLFLMAWAEARMARERQTFAGRMRGDRRDSVPLNGLQRELRRLQQHLPPEWIRSDERRLRQAYIGLGTESLLGLRLVAAACGTLGAGALGATVLSRTRLPAGVWASAGAVIGLLGLECLVSAAIIRRQAVLRRQWPGFLHRLELCLLAGLPLERSIRVVWSSSCNGQHHPVERGLAESVREMGAGASCEEALAHWALRSGSDDVQALSAVCQKARSLGMPLAPAIAKQSSFARSRQRQRHLAWLTSLPSRISLIAMVFFMPAILIVVLLPSVLSFLRSGW